MKKLILSILLVCLPVFVFSQSSWNPPKPSVSTLAYTFITKIDNLPILVDLYDTNGDGIEDMRVVYAIKEGPNILGGTLKIIQYAVDKNFDGHYSSNEIVTSPDFIQFLNTISKSIIATN